MEQRCPYCMGLLTSGGGNCPDCGQNPSSYRPPANQLPPGTILHERYQIGRALGAGGFGITYLGWDATLARCVAVKEYYPRFLVQRDAAPSLDVSCHTETEGPVYQKGKQGFLQEARTLSQMGHIHGIVQVHDFFEQNNTAYLVMEYLEGETFAQMVKRHGPLSMELLLKLLEPIFNALESVHRAGIIHRDISPDNLIVVKDGTVKLMDFGCAREIDSEQTMSVMLRHGYAPPEQYTGHNQEAWTDVYALCATMYYCLTGKAPPRAMERYENHDALQPPRALGAVMTPDQERALIKGLSIRHNERWQNVSDLHHALIPKPTPVPRPWKAIVGAAAVLTLIAGILFYLRPWNPKPNRESWRDNVLMEDWEEGRGNEDYAEYPVFGTGLSRKQVYTLTFLDSTKSAPENAWDVSQVKNRSVLAWTQKADKVEGATEDLYHLYIAGNGGVAAPANSSDLFRGYNHASELNLNNFHTDDTTNMGWMFAGCASAGTLNVSGFSTSNVTNMQGMFHACVSAEALDVSNFDTSNVIEEGMMWMFLSCNSVKTLDVSGFDTSQVTNVFCMFYGCHSLKTLDLSNFDVSNVRILRNMFAYCDSMETLDVSGFDTSNATDMSGMFYDCNSLKTLDVSGFDTSHVTNMENMFYGCINLILLDVSGFDTSNATNISWMFAHCNSLELLDVSGFDTSNVTTMGRMFIGCHNVKWLDVRSFDTSKVTDTQMMFYACRSLTELDISSFDTSNVTDMNCMFLGCENLTVIYASERFTTSKVTNGAGCFDGCISLKGGNGTAYHDDHKNADYARIDAQGMPGYFTAKE